MALPLAARRLPLAQRVARLQRPPGPPMRQLHRPLHLGVRNAVGRAFVEGHGDVDAHLRLDLDRRFRREEVRRAVEMTAELDPLLPDLADAGQGKDLEPARIRQHGPVPAHEAVHAPELLQQVRPRAEHEVVRVVEDDLGTECRLLAAGRWVPAPELLQLIRRQALDAGQRPHRHEDRRLDRAVRSRDPAAARRSIRVEQLELQSRLGTLHSVPGTSTAASSLPPACSAGD